MIIQLSKKKIKILPMKIPEPTSGLYIQYTFEQGTNHLLPRLKVNGKTYEGNKIYIDLSEGFVAGNTEMKVELLDGNKVPVKTYTGIIPQYSYVLYGKKPIRPDLDDYNRQLERRIIELEEEGDVI